MLRLNRSVFSTFSLITFAASASLLGGCHKTKPSASATAKPVKPAPPAIDYATIRPNELGRIPVIMYHEIGGKPLTGGAKPLWRSEASFRADLEAMYKANWRPVNLSDVTSGKIDVPAGKTPVVLTFDDGRATQFQLLEEASTMRVDPHCAVGILQEFHKSHPDWQMRATFFILPKSKVTMEVFRQTGMSDQKLKYLVDQGMEIGNHTTLHHSVSPMSPAQIQQELGNANNFITAALPNYKVVSFALPMGKYPRNKANVPFLLKGIYEGKEYDHRAVMLAAYRPIPSPFAKEYNPAKLERIGAVDGRFGVRFWVDDLSKGGGMYERYISDGDPNRVSYPRSMQTKVAVERLTSMGLTANPYGGASSAKPIMGAESPVETPSDSSPTAPQATSTTPVPSAKNRMETDPPIAEKPIKNAPAVPLSKPIGGR